MNKIFLYILQNILVISFFEISKASGEIFCDNNNRCPVIQPCCSQFNTCGSGLVCLGGCNPYGSFKDNACMSMPVMDSFFTQFNSLNLLQHERDYIGNTEEIDWVYTGHVAIHEDKLLLQLPRNASATVISSTTYLLFGKVSVTMKTSRGHGIISAFILYSNLKDEIDYEFIGSSLDKVQTNYYSRGILNHTHFTNSKILNSFSDFHTYTIDWKEDKLSWYVDGRLIRVLKKNDTWDEETNRYFYPLTPSRIQISLWPGGLESASEGVRDWAGGYIDWNHEDVRKHGYYYSMLDKINVQSYSHEKKLRFKGLESEHPLSYDFSTDCSSNPHFFTCKLDNVLINSGASGLDMVYDQNDTICDRFITSYNTTGRSAKTKKTIDHNPLNQELFQCLNEDDDISDDGDNLVPDQKKSYKRIKKKITHSSSAYTVDSATNFYKTLIYVTLYTIYLFMFT